MPVYVHPQVSGGTAGLGLEPEHGCPLGPNLFRLNRGVKARSFSPVSHRRAFLSASCRILAAQLQSQRPDSLGDTDQAAGRIGSRLAS